MATKRNVLIPVLIATAVVGVIDGADAAIFTVARGAPPGRVFQFIASVVIGKEAFQMGISSMALGVVLHFCVALVLTSIYFAFAPVFERMTRNWFLSGFFYGVVTYVVMNHLVLPVLGVKTFTSTPTWPGLLNGVLAHIFCVGLPIAFFAARHRRAARGSEVAA